MLTAHLEKYILLKNPPESDQWFQSYEQLKDSQHNRKQRNSFLFLAITINAPDLRMILLDRNTYYGGDTTPPPTKKISSDDKVMHCSCSLEGHETSPPYETCN